MEHRMSVSISGPATAFVIEDDPFARWALGQFLESLRFTVLSAETYTDAAALIAGHPPPRLAVVDLALRDNPAERIPQSRSRGITLVHGHNIVDGKPVHLRCRMGGADAAE